MVYNVSIFTKYMLLFTNDKNINKVKRCLSRNTK